MNDQLLTPLDANMAAEYMGWIQPGMTAPQRRQARKNFIRWAKRNGLAYTRIGSRIFFTQQTLSNAVAPTHQGA